MDIQQKTVNNLRVLAADTVQKANSGHPGAPMGMAPMAYALWMKEMKHNPADPAWQDRDRFVLSAGHASALLYSLLHLTGYGLTMDDLKSFRQWGSKTPGHPEYRHTVGVETTTGPLGQGVANAVGFAIAETMLAAHFNRPGFPIVYHRVYALCGDGCMMEGISSEAASLAGTLKLGKLTLLYDDNEISIEGDTDIAFRENVGGRFEAYGWHVIRLKDGNDVEAVCAAIQEAKKDDRPSLIICPTRIGFGCPAKEGKASAHGEPLGEDNVLAVGLVFCFVVYYYSMGANKLINMFKDAAGIWRRDRWRPLTAALVNLGLNLLTVRRLGLYGVLLSSVFSIVFVQIPWLFRNLFLDVFPRPYMGSYIRLFCGLAAVALISGGASWFVCSLFTLNVWSTLFLNAVCSFLIPNLCYYIFYGRNPLFRESLSQLKRSLLSRARTT